MQSIAEEWRWEAGWRAARVLVGIATSLCYGGLVLLKMCALEVRKRWEVNSKDCPETGVQAMIRFS